MLAFGSYSATSSPAVAARRGSAVQKRRIDQLAAECAVPAPSLMDAMASVPVFSQERVLLVTRLLATIANTLSEIGFQGYELRAKLQQMAEIVKSL